MQCNIRGFLSTLASNMTDIEHEPLNIALYARTCVLLSLPYKGRGHHCPHYLDLSSPHLEAPLELVQCYPLTTENKSNSLESINRGADPPVFTAMRYRDFELWPIAESPHRRDLPRSTRPVQRLPTSWSDSIILRQGLASSSRTKHISTTALPHFVG